MRDSARASWRQSSAGLWVIGLVACLCFSAGEGLRLTPLPVSPSAAASPADARLMLTGPLSVSAHKYGPLHMPAQAQKHGRRQLPDWTCPPSAGSDAAAADLRRDPCAGPRVASASEPSGSGPADRGPPLGA